MLLMINANRQLKKSLVLLQATHMLIHNINMLLMLSVLNVLEGKRRLINDL